MIVIIAVSLVESPARIKPGEDTIARDANERSVGSVKVGG